MSKVRSVLLAAVAAVAFTSFATNYTWTGGGEAGSWKDPANWGGGGYPHEAADTVTFDTAGELAITLDTGAVTEIGPMTVTKGSVTIGGTTGSSFHMNGDAGGTIGKLTCEKGAKIVFDVPVVANIRYDRYKEGDVVFRSSYVGTDASYPLITCCGTNIVEGTASFSCPNGSMYFGMSSAGLGTTWPFFIRDQATLATKGFDYAGGGTVPDIQVIQDGDETAVTISSELKLNSATRYNDDHAYILRRGNLKVATVRVAASKLQDGTMGDPAKEHFIVEGGTARVYSMNLGSASAALKGGVLTLTGGSGAVSAAAGCSLNVYGGTLAVAVSDKGSTSPKDITGVRYQGRFELVATNDNNNGTLNWDWSGCDIADGATFVATEASRTRLDMQHHVCSGNMGLEIVTNLEFRIPSPAGRSGEARTTVTAPGGSYAPWRVKVDEGATLKLGDSSSRLQLPLDLTVEGTGKINFNGHRNFIVAHRLTVGGAELAKGRYVADGTYGWLTNGKTGSVVVPYVWTGAGDGTSWSDPLNWEGGEVPPSAATTCVDLSQAKSVALSGDLTLGCIIAMPNDVTRKTAVTGSGTLTLADAAAGAAGIYVSEERELTLDVNVARGADLTVAVQGGGRVVFKKAVPGAGASGDPVLAVDATVVFDGATVADALGGESPILAYAGSETISHGVISFGGEGASLAADKFVLGPGTSDTGASAGVCPDEFHQTGGTLTFGEFTLGRLGAATGHIPVYFLEGGTLTVTGAAKLQIGNTLSDAYSARFVMTGGTLNFGGGYVSKQDRFEASGGLINCCYGGEFGTESGQKGYVGFYLGGVTFKTFNGISGVLNDCSRVFLTGVNGDLKLDLTDYYFYLKAIETSGPGGLYVYKTGTKAGDCRIRSNCTFTGALTADKCDVWFETSNLNGPKVLRTKNGGIIRITAAAAVSKSPDVIDLESAGGLQVDASHTLTVKKMLVGGNPVAPGTYTGVYGGGTVIVLPAPESWVDAEGNGDLTTQADGATVKLASDTALNSLTYGSASGSGTVTLAPTDGEKLIFNDGATIAVERGSTLVIDADAVLGGKVSKIGGGEVRFNGAVSAPDGVDLTVAANDVYWLTARHGTATFDGAVTGVRIMTASSDGDIPLVNLEANCTVSDYAMVLTAYTDGSAAVRGETHQNGAAVDYSTMPAAIKETFKCYPISHPAGGSGRYVLNSGTFLAASGFSFMAASGDHGTFEFVQNGGTLDSKGNISFARNTDGLNLTYTINGGTLYLRTAPTSFDRSMANVNFNGGEVYFCNNGLYLDTKLFNVKIGGDVTFRTDAAARTPVLACEFAGPGKVTFAGPGMFQLTGCCLLDELVVSAGKVRFGQSMADQLPAGCIVRMTSESVLDLAYDGVATVEKLVLDDVEMRPKTYRPGVGRYGSLFSGKGALEVLDGPIPGAMILVR